MTQSNRLMGGQIDRRETLKFTFDGKTYQGHPGDTLASALLANGVRLMARSFKYHRPRGVFSMGSDEPNALMTIGRRARRDPNTRATVQELYSGLIANSQSKVGSLKYDLMAVNDLMSPFFGAGFYYKTFMWPAAFWEKVYEPIIRKAAGLGALSGKADPDFYDKGYLHCDVLVIGAGSAGLMAALTAGRAGARVILADEDFAPGGRLNAETCEVDGQSGAEWARGIFAELSTLSNVRLMTRTTVFGAFDHGIFGALERCTDHLAEETRGDGPRQTLWRIYAKRSILAAGATERSVAFGNNDRPGIMLASAVRGYANRYGVTPGQRVAVFTTNDDGWRTAHDLAAKGVKIAAVIDSRSGIKRAAPNDAPTYTGRAVQDTQGRLGLKSITLSNGKRIYADCLAVAGGYSPSVHLTCHMRGRPVWREDIAAFVPGADLPPGMRVAGAANGTFGLGAGLREAAAVARETLDDLGIAPMETPTPRADDETYDIAPLWHVTSAKGRCFIDTQHDVTTKDLGLAHREGFVSVEHMKRYTTLGMATDQGKTSNVLGLAVMADLSGRTIPEVGTTIFRPPYTPVPISAFAGRARGHHYMPTRRTPAHDWAIEQGASMVESGLWMRAEWFTRSGEKTWRQSCDREALNTRQNVGIADVTTLGKIDIKGRDAAEFLSRVYVNGFAKLRIGRVRYGLMLREDGFAMDDGTTARLGEAHFLMTTTTANAAGVMRHLEFARQCLWPDMDVHLTSVTDHWAQFAVAGPRSRELLAKVVAEDISDAALPYMGCIEATVGGVQGRVFRISFSGELAYEVAVPSRYGDALARALMTAGEEFGVMPYGLEALNVMRIEKGHPTANELNGQTTAADLGLGKMVSTRKDCIGKVLSQRPALRAEDRMTLAGFKPVDPDEPLTAGMHFLSRGARPSTENDEGWMSSVCYSPNLGHSIGLGFIKFGTMRRGDRVRAVDLLRGREVEVEIVSPHFLDPEGERLRG